MVDFKQTPDMMDDAVLLLRNNSARLLQLGDELRTGVRVGTQDFEGATQQQFTVAEAEYNKAHVQIQDTVGRASAKLEEINTLYKNNESLGKARWTI